MASADSNLLYRCCNRRNCRRQPGIYRSAYPALIGGCKALFSGGNKGLVYKMVVLCHDYWLHRIRHDVRFKRLFYSREQIVRKQRKDDSRKTSEEKAMTMPKKN
ncbi:hypothetical protein PO124_25930 [Bacillus licheniformis]|nr:hypothetical protein [Bacillus licheniformis]